MVAVFAIYAFLPAVALSALPVVNGETKLALPKEQGGFADDPILGVVKNLDLGALQPAAEIYVGVLAATILFIATNAGMIGVSRLTYSMGQYRQLPERLRTLHPRYGTPYMAILVFGFVACVTILPGQAEFLGTIYAFGAMLSFTIAHLSVVALRVKQPDAERPWRGPGTLRIRGRELPLFAIVGGAGTAIAWIVVTALNIETLIVGSIWLAVGVITYVVYRRRQGLPLTETHKIVIPKPVVEHEVEYESILVAFEDGELLGRGGGHRGEARRDAAAGNPRAGDHHRPSERANRRDPARAGGPCGVADRLRPSPRRPAGDGTLGEGPPGPGRP